MPGAGDPRDPHLARATPDVPAKVGPHQREKDDGVVAIKFLVKICDLRLPVRSPTWKIDPETAIRPLSLKPFTQPLRISRLNLVPADKGDPRMEIVACWE